MTASPHGPATPDLNSLANNRHHAALAKNDETVDKIENIAGDIGVYLNTKLEQAYMAHAAGNSNTLAQILDEVSRFAKGVPETSTTSVATRGGRMRGLLRNLNN
jgi:hypothetical protein